MPFLDEIRQRAAQGPTPEEQARDRANQQYNRIAQECHQALTTARRDWIALECVANHRDYAKPDSMKRFVLWEANMDGRIQYELGANVQTEHPWLVQLFLPGRVARFPFNTGDSNATHSLSPDSIVQDLRRTDPEQYWILPRWSTASRSSVALVPRSLAELHRIDAWPGADERSELRYQEVDLMLNMSEWQTFQQDLNQPNQSNRFHRVVPNPGRAASIGGIPLGDGQYRLYSIKTGVDFVGSKNEGPDARAGGKHRLEANSSMAMLRSNTARSLRNNDATFDIQLELLTVTAPLRNDGTYQGGRDGFQVRDLSCLKSGVHYMPGQAIPYGRAAFDGAADANVQKDFWRKNFAVPLGRAKARLFLNFGLIHTSANAQNFVLGFQGKGGLGPLQTTHFVVRDLGDTSWHDDYIRGYLIRFGEGAKVWQAFNNESSAPIRHVLGDTSSGDYPAPFVVRLAAYSVLTHGFADTLGWNRKIQYEFVTGIFDGFRSYISEVLNTPINYPNNPPNNTVDNQLFANMGTNGRYPHRVGNAYCNQMNLLKQQSVATLLARAAWARERATTGLGAASSDDLQSYVAIEESCLCCAIEKILLEPESGGQQWLGFKAQLQNAFNGNWPSVVVDI